MRDKQALPVLCTSTTTFMARPSRSIFRRATGGLRDLSAPMHWCCDKHREPASSGKAIKSGASPHAAYVNNSFPVAGGMVAGATGGAAGSMCTITTQTLRNLLKAFPTQQWASQHHSLPKKTASPAEAAFDVAQGASYCVKAAGICKLPQCKAE